MLKYSKTYMFYMLFTDLKGEFVYEYPHIYGGKHKKRANVPLLTVDLK